ncbi:MAG: hypothetical protein S4CHLAM81_03440 [Chlamydiales bacterium]|nr:hypothetical protein [Chlamydiales bacterium]MCH9635134.1 hypothetical protein [Chlamydiales bacterium]
MDLVEDFPGEFSFEEWVACFEELIGGEHERFPGC